MVRWIAIAVSVLALGGGAVGLAVAQGDQSAPARAKATGQASSRTHPKSKRHRATSHRGTRSRRDDGSGARSLRARNVDENTPGDTDNVRQGDQTAPENGAENDNNGERESNDDAETGQPGEPPAGKAHEDQPGQDVNHECTGDCVE